MDARTERMLTERQPRPAASGPRGRRHPASLAAWVGTARGLAAIGMLVIVAALAGGRYLTATRAAADGEHSAVEQQRAKLAIEAEIDRSQASLEACLAAGDAERTARWNRACRERRRQNGCSLLRDVAAAEQRAHSDKRADCLRRFSLGSGVR